MSLQKVIKDYIRTECNEIEKMLSAITKTMAEKIKRSGAL